MSRFVFTAALICAAPAVAETRFFAAIDDLPLPPGFSELDAGAAFESEGGRIILVHAEGRLSLLEVRDFYCEVLPPLGWAESPQPDGMLVFRRGREELSFTADRDGVHTRLGARLIVHPASMNAD